MSESKSPYICCVAKTEDWNVRRDKEGQDETNSTSGGEGLFFQSLIKVVTHLK